MAENNDGPRRSRRLQKQPPLEVNAEEEESETEVSVSDGHPQRARKSSHSRSRASGSSVSSSLLRLRLELLRDKEIEKIEEAIADLQFKVDMAAVDYNVAKKTFEVLKEREEQLTDDEAKEMRKAHFSMLTAEGQLEAAKAKLKRHKSLVDAKKKTINSQHAVNIEEVEEEEEEVIPIPVPVQSGTERAKDWVADLEEPIIPTTNHEKATPPIPINQSQKSPEEIRRDNASIPRPSASHHSAVQNVSQPPPPFIANNAGNGTSKRQQSKRYSDPSPRTNYQNQTQRGSQNDQFRGRKPPDQNVRFGSNPEIIPTSSYRRGRGNNSVEYAGSFPAKNSTALVPLHPSNPNPNCGNPNSNLAQDLTTALASVFGKSRLSLPNFNGNPAQWNAFYGEFQRTKTTNAHDNMRRLSEAVQPPARKYVEYLFANPTDINVQKVEDILGRMYGRPEAIIQYMMEQAKSSKPVDISKPDSMVNFGTTVDTLITNIVSFNRPNFLYDSYLLGELVRKLPSSLQSSWFELAASKDQDMTLNDFNFWLQPKVDGAMLQIVPKCDVREDRPRSTGRRGPGENLHVSAEVACGYCENKGHSILECRKFSRLQNSKKWEHVKEKKLCFICLEEGHGSPDCSLSSCSVPDCGKKHHKILHPDKEKKKENVSTIAEDAPSESEDDNDDNPHSSNTASINSIAASDSLPIIAITIKGETGSEMIFALLDTGASCCVLDGDVAKKIGASGKSAPFSYAVFGDDKVDTSSQIVSVKVNGAFKKSPSFTLDKVRTVSELNLPKCSINGEQLKKKYEHLRGMNVPQVNNVQPKMIIGFNYFRLFAPREILESKDSSAPVAFRSYLGWYVTAPGKGANSIFTVAVYEREDYLHNLMKEFFSTENFGVKFLSEPHRSEEDKQAMKLLKSTTVKKNGRWETGLLWKDENVKMPNNYKMAMKRLLTMEKKMDRDPAFAKLVCEKFEEYISNNFMKEADLSSLKAGRIWYLPWFFAYHPTKKPRFVLDAAAKYEGRSLNDYLVTGPDLIQPLPAILIRFRVHEIALVGDLEHMFHNVTMRQPDRSSQLVLYRGMDRTKPPIVFEMTVLIFGSKPSPCSAIYAKDANAEEHKESHPEAVRAIIEDHFVDDMIGGDKDVPSAIKLRKEITEIHASGGFPMKKWNSNSQELLKTIPLEERAHGDMQLSDKSEFPVDKTLGLYWNSQEDCFLFKLNTSKIPKDVLEEIRRPTKREVASLIMSLFDPIGFLAPIKTKGLIVLQQTWREGIHWDDEVSERIEVGWKEWIAGVKAAEKIRIPRKIPSLEKDTAVTAHVFCDASEEAFAVAVYLLFNTRGSLELSFIAGKSRVAPIRPLTIPRMELQAAVMGIRLFQMVAKALQHFIPIQNVRYWTDSKTVLMWLRSVDKRYNQFIGNRIGEALEASNSYQWKWVPSALNVADDATRLKSKEEMCSSSRWLIGPDFLLQNEDNWPVETWKAAEVAPEDLEMKEDILHLLLLTCKNDALPNPERFSSWWRLVRAAAAVPAALRRILQKIPFEINMDDIKGAELRLMKLSQQQSFPEELATFQSGKELDTKSRLFKLSPTLNEDGLIVLCGRISHAEGISDLVKFPIILCPQNYITKLLITWYHNQSQHFGQERIVNELRKKYWIIGCRSAVRREFARCGFCVKRRVHPATAMMGQLPLERMESYQPPFYNTGVDLFGPYQVTVKRSTEKRWGVIFTCLTTRAVHLDLVESLSASDFINALTRFICIRGKPNLMMSDNGTNFVGTDTIINDNLKIFNKYVEEHLQTKGITWKRIPPGSPSMGGVYERMIGSTKQILSSLLKSQHPKEGVLRTLLYEVMDILNSRPLTYASPDPKDTICLTPNHLLRLSCIGAPPIPCLSTDNFNIGKSWEKAQYLADQFWKEWSESYLPSLAKRCKGWRKSSPLKVGDIVLVVNELARRNDWKRGIVTQTFPGKDGVIRVVEVKVATVDPADKEKKPKFSTFRRHVSKLCPLSVREDNPSGYERENDAECKSPAENPTTVLPEESNTLLPSDMTPPKSGAGRKKGCEEACRDQALSTEGAGERARQEPSMQQA